MNNSLQQILTYIKTELALMEKNRDDMDSASFGYAEGVLLTGNQAKALLNALITSDRPIKICYKFFYPEEPDGWSFHIAANSAEEAFVLAEEAWGPQVESMVCKAASKN